jgi:L-threonylcarbamoyladenylate synthase
VVSGQSAEAVRSPGLLLSHYAPSLPLRINAQTLAPGEALLAFGAPIAGAALAYQLSETGNLNEAAARLFEGLHWLDASAPARSLTGIAAMAIPAHGIGRAINDRLTRAAAPRP